MPLRYTTWTVLRQKLDEYFITWYLVDRETRTSTVYSQLVFHPALGWSVDADHLIFFVLYAESQGQARNTCSGAPLSHPQLRKCSKPQVSEYEKMIRILLLFFTFKFLTHQNPAQVLQGTTFHLPLYPLDIIKVLLVDFSKIS